MTDEGTTELFLIRDDTIIYIWHVPMFRAVGYKPCLRNALASKGAYTRNKQSIFISGQMCAVLIMSPGKARNQE